MVNGKSDTIMRIANLTKRYGSFTAVNQLSFDVRRGEVFGFLGPNGAGKTTTINMLCGLLKPDKGEISINGTALKTDEDKAREIIGLCPQNIVIWAELTCMEQLEFMGQMYGLGREQARRNGLELLEALGLLEKKDKLAKTLSGGMQRRLNIALALIHRPEILIIDEPQAGLDPQSRIFVRDYIRRLSKKVTVILTTHDMDEAERLSDRVAIIDHGQLLVLDTPGKIKEQAGIGEILELKVRNCSNIMAQSILRNLVSGTGRKSYRDGVFKIESTEILEILPYILQTLKDNSIETEDMTIRKRTLEDVFISYTGRGLRE